MDSLKRVIPTLILMGIGVIFDHFAQHLMAVFFMCCAANAVWYDAPKDDAHG